MYDDLRERIEIFKNRKICLLHPQEFDSNDNLKISSSWRKILQDKSPIPEKIRHLWSPILGEAKPVVEFLASTVFDLVIACDFENELAVQLVYVFEVHSKKFGNTFLNAWVAGPPLSEVKTSTFESAIGFKIPEEFVRFCGVHNGFTLNGNMAIGVLPLERARLFTPENSKKVLLEFCGDGLGNLRCFDMLSSLPITLDWDHETHQVDHPQAFWDYFHHFINHAI